ncbi:MAG TPA: PDZ domain-containing protein [Blastocatellia bacterium]|nr:PDZ domain-containing protein [Blastocatellia bacterium]
MSRLKPVFSSLGFIIPLLFISLIVTPVLAQRPKPKNNPPAPAPPPLRLEYTLSFPQPHTHLYEVTLAVGNVTTPQLELSLPVWTPGSYLVREYARHVQDFAARDEAGQSLRWNKTDKSTWRITAGISDGKPRTVRVSYRVYANELFTQTSHLDASHAYFNGASLFMYVPSAKDQPHRLKIVAPEGWRVTTPLALAPEADGFYTAPNYDVLVDSPTEIGTHKLLEFTVRNKPHRVAIWGAYEFDDNRLKEDLAKIVEQGAQLFGGLPYEHYTFIVHVQPGIGGGTEHLNSNVSQTRPEVFKTARGYKGFLGLESHEYFHLWNVKRIRPLALGPFDYQRENYTHNLWLSEGVTSYYGEQLLRRAGLITTDDYLEGIANLIMGYERQPGRFEQSAETASFNAWIKHYRPDENSVNTTLSYYTRGEMLGWLLDFEIRTRTGGAKSLDDVMRLLLENYGLPKPGFTDAELKAAFEKIAGADLSDFFNRYVSGTEDPDFNHYFQLAGLQLTRAWQPSPYLGRDDKPGWLGFATREGIDRVTIASVLAGTPAYTSGLNANDEIVAMNGLKIDRSNVRERLAMLRAGDEVSLTIFRREKLMTFSLKAAVKPYDLYRITRVKEMNPQQLALYEAWLKQEMKS